MRSRTLSVFAALAVPAPRPHLYLASTERRSFLVRDGMQTPDVLFLGPGPNKGRFSSSSPVSHS
jgi:hypothetical protein